MESEHRSVDVCMRAWKLRTRTDVPDPNAEWRKDVRPDDVDHADVIEHRVNGTKVLSGGRCGKYMMMHPPVGYCGPANRA